MVPSIADDEEDILVGWNPVDTVTQEHTSLLANGTNYRESVSTRVRVIETRSPTRQQVNGTNFVCTTAGESVKSSSVEPDVGASLVVHSPPARRL